MALAIHVLFHAIKFKTPYFLYNVHGQQYTVQCEQKIRTFSQTLSPSVSLWLTVHCSGGGESLQGECYYRMSQCPVPYLLHVCAVQSRRT